MTSVKALLARRKKFDREDHAERADSMTEAIRKLPLSFTRLADFGVPETTKVFCPIASKRGATAARMSRPPAAATSGRPNGVRNRSARCDQDFDQCVFTRNAESVATEQHNVTTATDPITAVATEASQRFGIPASWIRAVMQVESFGDVRALSPKGAMGLMQIMPEAWAAAFPLRSRRRPV
jgi:hypothetical protein